MKLVQLNTHIFIDLLQAIGRRDAYKLLLVQWGSVRTTAYTGKL